MPCPKSHSQKVAGLGLEYNYAPVVKACYLIQVETNILLSLVARNGGILG